MDRSYLSDESVVAASRHFVCIRLSTYEDADEAEYMKRLFLPRSGVLENTTFSILAPDGKRKLSASGRGPRHMFRNASAMASTMNRIAKQYPAKRSQPDQQPALPLMKDVALALNVAASDNLPLVVINALPDTKATAATALLRQVAWTRPLSGQFVYALAKDSKELKAISGAKPADQILVIEPGQFGLEGKVLTTFDHAEDAGTAKAKLMNVTRNFSRQPSSHRSHVRKGIELGIDWESQIPETDPMSIRARQRMRGRQ